MKHTTITFSVRVAIVFALALASGCGSEPSKAQQDREFFTSGSKEADQRAQQRMVKSQQLQGASTASNTQKSGKGVFPTTNEKKSLYDRLGGDQGITLIVDDFVTRALADPRVNFSRKGVIQGGVFTLHHAKPMEWNASADNVAKLKLHMTQFIALATGGPSEYQGKPMQSAHTNMHITNAEYDAAVGDLKATLDKLHIASQEQKELLAIIESARPEIVEQR